MIPESVVKERVEAFPEMCRRAGLKVTHQRTAVYSMLAGTDTHPCPEEVYESIRPSLPSISLATIYKILDLFHSHGFVRRLSTKDQVARYDANLDIHHHMICTSCGGIDDVDAGALPPPRLEDLPFPASQCEVLFYGMCPACHETGVAHHA